MDFENVCVFEQKMCVHAWYMRTESLADRVSCMCIMYIMCIMCIVHDMCKQTYMGTQSLADLIFR